MVKKLDKYAGMQDMFVQQAIYEKTAMYESARAKLEAEIEALEKVEDNMDSGMSAVETRNEIRDLREAIRCLEQQHYEELLKLKSVQK